MSLLDRILSFLGFLRPATAEVRSDAVIMRHNKVHDLYDKIIGELGNLGAYVSKGYIYDRIKGETGLSIRQIGRILNHTRREELYGYEEKKR